MDTSERPRRRRRGRALGPVSAMRPPMAVAMVALVVSIRYAQKTGGAGQPFASGFGTAFAPIRSRDGGGAAAALSSLPRAADRARPSGRPRRATASLPAFISPPRGSSSPARLGSRRNGGVAVARATVAGSEGATTAASGSADSVEFPEGGGIGVESASIDGAGAEEASSAGAIDGTAPSGDDAGAAAAGTTAEAAEGDDDVSALDMSLPTVNGGYSHTTMSKAKISAANKGKVPWNKGKGRSEEVKKRIADGVRRKNRERFLAKLADIGMTEEEYEADKKEERRKKDAERRARKTEKGGYTPTKETRNKISKILKEKWANGEVKKRAPSTGARRVGFKHTEETKQKIRDSLRKRWATDPEYRAKKEAAAKKQNSSKDARQRIAETLRQKWQDPEFRAYMMEKMATRKKSSPVIDEEQRRKISLAMKMKWQDGEYRAKAVDGMRKKAEEMGQRPPRKKSSGQPKKEEIQRVEVADGIFAVSPVAPKKMRRSRSTKVRVSADGMAFPKKRKKRKKKTVVDADDIDGSGSLLAAKPLSAPMSTAEEDDGHDIPENEGDGSLSRLRRERRDLYDLLYGDADDEDTAFATEAALYDKRTDSERRTTDNQSVTTEKPQKKNAPVRDPTMSSSATPFSQWDVEDEFDDENLDNFDPYGLDDH